MPTWIATVTSAIRIGAWLIGGHHTTLFVSCPDIHIVFLILGVYRFEDEIRDPWDISLELSFYLIDEYSLEWSDDISIELLE